MKLSLTTNEMEGYYHHQRMNIPVPHKLLNKLKLKIVRNQEIKKKHLKYYELRAKIQPVTRMQFLTFVPQNFKNQL